MIIDLKPSPNEGPRPAGAKVSLIVLHATEGSDDGAVEWLTSMDSGVSAHYHIGRTGKITRLVEEHRRAWHAGRSQWGRWHDVNDVSIGIELGNVSPEPYTDAQYRALGELLADLGKRYGLTMREVVAHFNVAVPAGRKSDPAGLHWGRVFDEMQFYKDNA